MKLTNCLGLTIAFSVFLSASIPAVAADDTKDEASYIGVLQSQSSSPKEKDQACVWLKRHGTAKSVPALATLLTDEQLSVSARYALESMPASEAEDALITGLSQTSGVLKAGVIGSLGIRGDARAVPELAKSLADSDELIARESAHSLGDIGTPDALKALEGQLKSASGSVQTAVIDGCFRGAQHLLAAGDRKGALAVYQEIYNEPTKEFLHVAAYRGMVLASGAQGADLIAKAITDGPAPLQMAAVQLVHEKQIPGVTKAVVKLLPTVDPLVQVALIGALSQREDTAAVPAIAALAKSDNTDVRVAAVTVLGTLGSDKEIPVLIDVASVAGNPAQTPARQALGLVHRGNPNQALLGMLSSSKGEQLAEVIRALTSRSAVEATPQLLQLAQQADDSVRDTAFQALARLTDQSKLETLVQIVGQMKSDAGRDSAAGAVIAACRHIKRAHGTVDMSPVWAELKSGAPETRIALLPACSAFAEPAARDILRAALADQDAKVHAAAVRALCDTTDPELLPDVQKLATNASDAEFRTIAIEACVRLAVPEEGATLPDAQRIALLESIAPAASSAADKRVVLSALVTLSDAHSLQLAESLVPDMTVSNEAARTVIAIARTLPDAEAAKTALNKLLSAGLSEENRQNADTALKTITARAEYITTWEYAGPYRQTGKDYAELFDIAFPPEMAGVQVVNWQKLPLSDAAKRPWEMDLLKAMGGEQEVAYARTSIHSASRQAAWLLVNSDDGVKIWLNGEVVHSNNATRAISGPPDKVQITLKPGWNDLLLKVTQHNMGWGFCVKLTDLDGAQLKSVRYAATPGQSPM